MNRRSSSVLALVALGACASAARADPLSQACTRFSGHDVDGDGEAELQALTPLDTPAASEGGRVLVLVEERLLTDLGAELDLRGALGTYAQDLIADGFRPVLISTRLERSERHQDGRTLLALRRFFQAVAAEEELAGAVLVGAFPDALLVRTCNWIRKRPLNLKRATPPIRTKEPTWHLRNVPESVAMRADIVLADLDGSWEERYVQAKTALPAITGVFPAGVPPAGGVAARFERRTVTCQDFFLIDDGVLGLEEVAGGLKMTPRWDETDGECAASDRRLQNPLAQPEISVSRINARGVALSPREGFLDARGQPRAVRYARGQKIPRWSAVWRPDPRLERELLLEYFARNHRFRRGYVARQSFRPASISHGLRSGMKEVRRGHRSWQGFNEPGYDAHGASLPQLVAWLQRPAALRTVRAHSDAWGSVFRRASVAALHTAVGTPWSWTRQGRALVPSLEAACKGGKLDFFLLRSLWANGVRPAPSLVIHTGCDGISPPGASRVPYHHPRYDRASGGEAFLFYAGALALVGRAKVFYDAPRGFSSRLARGETFGDAWRHYYRVESRGPTFSHVGGRIGRKRAYFWSVLGDWTLRLREPPRWR